DHVVIHVWRNHEQARSLGAAQSHRQAMTHPVQAA
ncbi:MAG: hypothetical protein RL033_2969, partial [Pseudomonadota bacterium]